VKPDISSVLRFLPTAPAFDASIGALEVIAMPYGMEKLEWFGYQMVKKA